MLALVISTYVIAMTLKHKASLKSLNFGKTKAKGGSAKKPIGSGLATLLHKWKEAFRNITKDTLDQMDDESSDEQIDALFDKSRNAVPVKNILSFRAMQKEEEDMAKLEMKLTDEQSAENPTSIGRTTATSLGRTTATSHSEQPAQLSSSDSNEDETETENEEETFDNYDDVKACKQLRKQKGEPFCDAAEIWRHRRDLWQQTTNGTTKNDIVQRRHDFQQIPTEYYDRIYKKLVMEDKPLREPLNLHDALRVINAGWTETKKWERAANGIA